MSENKRIYSYYLYKQTNSLFLAQNNLSWVSITCILKSSNKQIVKSSKNKQEIRLLEEYCHKRYANENKRKRMCLNCDATINNNIYSS